MRRRIGLLIVLPALFVLGLEAHRSFATVPPAQAFRLKIVDATTGVGVAGVRVVSDNGIICHTSYDGQITWTETALMGRDVRFTVDAEPKGRVVTLHVERGNRAQVSLPLDSSN
jgi:hypothetical protein